MEWRWASASTRGTSHIRAGTRCDDASRTFVTGADRSTLVVIASDGAGSARFGRHGAVLVCRGIAAAIQQHFSIASLLPEEDVVLAWLDDIRDAIGAAAASRGATMRDFAATLVATIITADSACILHVGDGAVVVRTADGWSMGSWPAHGEYASTTFFVTDDQGPQLRVTWLLGSPDAVAVFTDGIERLVLDMVRQVPHGPFFEAMIGPVIAAPAPGRSSRLSSSLATYLGGDAVNARTDDDKTLILAARV